MRGFWRYSFDAASTGRTITLPKVPGGTKSLSLVIHNGSSGAASLAVNDPTGPTLVLTLAQGQIGLFFSIGTAWKGISG